MVNLQWPPALVQRAQRLSLRDRQMLTMLAVFLLAVLLLKGLWQPAQQRLQHAERVYQQRLQLAAQLQQARPAQPSPSSQPLPSRLSDSATTAGLDLLQMESDNQGLSMTLKGEARTLLGWLIQTEREGGQMQSLTLDKQDEQLHARVVWRLDSSGY